MNCHERGATDAVGAEHAACQAATATLDFTCTAGLKQLGPTRPTAAEASSGYQREQRENS
jgi:hypothetical protein